MVKEYCAIGVESKKAEDGRQALEHTRAERMVVWNFGEKDINTIRVMLERQGIPIGFINAIKMFYQNNFHNLKLDGESSPAFEVRSGVRQGCPSLVQS